MRLKIITQERVVFDEDVDEIYSKGIDGEFGGDASLECSVQLDIDIRALRNAGDGNSRSSHRVDTRRGSVVGGICDIHTQALRHRAIWTQPIGALQVAHNAKNIRHIDMDHDTEFYIDRHVVCVLFVYRAHR